MFRNLIRDAGDRVHEAADRASGYADDARGYARDYAGRAGEYADHARSYANDYAHRLGQSPLTHTTGKVPTDLFLIAAGGSIAASLVFKLLGRHRDAEFVGHWAPTFLALGLMSKLVEHADHEDRK